MNKQQLQQEIEQLQKQLEEKQKALAVMPERWEPKGGSFVILGDGNVSELNSFCDYRNFGSEYATRQQAEKAAKAMRAHNRLLAYVAEFAPDYEFQEGIGNWFVCFNYDGGGWMADYTYDRLGGLVYMTEKCAHTLAHKLNSGEVEL